MKISKAEVEYIANLARIKVSDADIELLVRDMSEMLEMAGKLNEVSTGADKSDDVCSDDVCSDDVCSDDVCVLRDDKVVPSYSREQILKNAPCRDDNSFIVPKIM